MDKTVKTIPKNKFQEIKFELKEFKGHNIIDIRIWNNVPDSDEKRPTTKGVTMNVELLPQLKEAVELLEKELTK
ncbi:MAG: transcriptional coactivator p15/PC4 family protein [Candidatus Omnitrophica bacterium]|nr:transcriptional coactivator p15/PC4 family protein [Candidatus Omnitrophota bacterium]